MGDKIAAERYIYKYESILKENLAQESDIFFELAEIYSEAGILQKSEEYYSKGFSLDPKNSYWIPKFIYILIDKDRNINKGLELVEKALNKDADNYEYLHLKGWGLYKLGKFEEARDILQRSWNLRRKYGQYDHPAYLHLEAAKKAVAGQKN